MYATRTRPNRHFPCLANQQKPVNPPPIGSRIVRLVERKNRLQSHLRVAFVVFGKHRYDMMSSYCSYNYDKRYFATSGELNIINVDTALRKLNATFYIQYRDTTSKGETVQISNGTINLNTWIRWGEPR